MSRRGATLLELLVALILLQLAGASALAVILTAERSGRRAAAGAREAGDWWTRYRTAELSPTCHDTMTARAVALRFDGDDGRDGLMLSLGCGQ